MSAYVKLGPRRRWPKPHSPQLMSALGRLVRGDTFEPGDRELLAAVVGAYLVLVYTSTRKRNADISALRRLTLPARRRRP
jgi:hypothetical protein